MKVRCRLFARYAELAGLEEVEIDLPGSATVADAVSRVRAMLRGGELIPKHTLVAVNHEHSPMDQVLHDGDELALLPPLAGG